MTEDEKVQAAIQANDLIRRQVVAQEKRNELLEKLAVNLERTANALWKILVRYDQSTAKVTASLQSAKQKAQVEPPPDTKTVALETQTAVAVERTVVQSPAGETPNRRKLPTFIIVAGGDHVEEKPKKQTVKRNRRAQKSV